MAQDNDTPEVIRLRRELDEIGRQICDLWERKSALLFDLWRAQAEARQIARAE